MKPKDPNEEGNFKNEADNGVPGPGSYNPKPHNPVPGFRIVPHKRDREHDPEDDKLEEKKLEEWMRRDPQHPAFTNKSVKFGTGTRDDQKLKFITPAPNNYLIKGDFEKGSEKPKFHMGIRTQGRTNKNLDMPGPGEYETDVIPMHHSNVQYMIGTSIRSDLGVGKSHQFPGPGEYEAIGKIEGA